jgi:hypothetical protein
MASLTTAQIVAFARAKVLELSDAVLSDAALLAYANQSKDEVALRAPSQRDLASTSLAVTAGVATVPSGYASFYGCKDSQVPGQGNEYRSVSLEDYRAGAHERMIVRLGAQFLVYPAISGTLYLDHYALPADLALTGSDPTADPTLHEVIAYGVVWRALEDLQDLEQSQYYRSKFEADLALRASALSQREEEPQDSGALFNGIDIIGGGSRASDPDRW